MSRIVAATAVIKVDQTEEAERTTPAHACHEAYENV